MSVISPYVYENDTYEDYLDGQLSEDDIHYLEVSSGPVVYVTGIELISDFLREGLAQQCMYLAGEIDMFLYFIWTSSCQTFSEPGGNLLYVKTLLLHNTR
jgi:hypothetical protein